MIHRIIETVGWALVPVIICLVYLAKQFITGELEHE